MADAALMQVGLTLEEVKGQFPHELSGGQLQRVAIVRALIPQPRLAPGDIASVTGVGSAEYLTLQFRTHYSVSPLMSRSRYL
ncbi:ABC transporter-like protein (plasmid) [Rhizobium gallicum bv. gallicum R602sp]|uniref:ABC transporter-like protein n=1 Tax=Rhizobium gallicum bv. gallicum R602sp TaxID=1041138 RepID=A0A0B4XIC1_9HYPH|nr:ABC transporter-like protein [Rhizobium gallicum bv. gallicum R602sp]